MKFERNVPLAQFTTFKIGGQARFFCHVTTEDDLVEALKFAKKERLRVFILGGGSNVLISDKGFPGLVVKIELKGVQYTKDDKKDSGHVLVTAAAGEMWDELVGATVERGLYGLENLSAIPGTVGAAPVQNIGAYGAEVSSVIDSVRVLNRKTLRVSFLAGKDCQFEYRDSVFKKYRHKYVITAVVLRLAKEAQVNVKYKDVSEYFRDNGSKGATPTLSEVRDAVIAIRWGKLPDWKLWGTAGSFFKNPLVSAKKWKSLKKQYPKLPGFPEADGRVKVALGWILDNVCDVKGLCREGACVYEKQALVIVSEPGSTAAEVVSLAQELMKRVKKETGISITGEVEWVN